MATTTNTNLDRDGGVETGPTGGRRSGRSGRTGRGALVWMAVLAAATAAVIVLVLAVALHGHTTEPAPGDAVRSRAAAAQRAEQYERQAHLDELARTYGQHPADTPTPTDEADTPGGQEFVPGSRHMPTR